MHLSPSRPGLLLCCSTLLLITACNYSRLPPDGLSLQLKFQSSMTRRRSNDTSDSVAFMTSNVSATNNAAAVSEEHKVLFYPPAASNAIQGSSLLKVARASTESRNSSWFLHWNLLDDSLRSSGCPKLLATLLRIDAANVIRPREPPQPPSPMKIGQRVIVYDNTDLGIFWDPACLRELGHLFGGPHNVYLAKRLLVEGRDFGCYDMRNPTCFPNETALLEERRGWPLNYSARGDVVERIHNGAIARLHFPVRLDLVEGISSSLLKGGLELWNESSSSNNSSNHKHNNPVWIPRTGDVAHFWKIEPGDEHGQLRNRVTVALLSMFVTENVTGVAGLVSPRKKEGRFSVNDAYVEGLLTHKIIIVCQRDKYEGHLRLMEALISGAMVMSDDMFHWPVGIKPGSSVVVYRSIADLKHKILYFLTHEDERLAIAEEGRKVALGMHMPWQGVERLVLGGWPKNASDNPVIAPLDFL